MTITENDLLAELVRENTFPLYDPAVHTSIDDVVDALDIGRSKAERLLDKVVASGRGEWIRVKKLDGKSMRVVVKVVK